MLICALTLPLSAQITNGGFESGLGGWTVADQIGSDGTFTTQSGTTSPVNGFTVPAPPQGTASAMSDAEGPGSHVLYQDFVVPAGAGPFSILFSLYIRNAEGAGDFFVPSLTTLDFSTPSLNQQARVDIITTTADPFSIAPADVLQNLYATDPGDPLTSGYTTQVADVTALFLAHAGETLRLRFAEVDNVSPMNLGVDNVALVVGAVSTSSATKTVSGTFVPGGNVTYTVVLTNGVLAQANNPGNEFVDVLPPQLTLSSANATSGTAVGTIATNTVTWNGAIPANGTVTITINATINSVSSGTLISNQGTSSYDSDGNGTNDATALTDDPSAGGASDPTTFTVGAAPAAVAVPALDPIALMLVALSLAAVAVIRVR
jgi:hypothetical protein